LNIHIIAKLKLFFLPRNQIVLVLANDDQCWHRNLSVQTQNSQAQFSVRNQDSLRRIELTQETDERVASLHRQQLPSLSGAHSSSSSYDAPVFQNRFSNFITGQSIRESSPSHQHPANHATPDSNRHHRVDMP
jgi:hypothetical protein